MIYKIYSPDSNHFVYSVNFVIMSKNLSLSVKSTGIFFYRNNDNISSSQGLIIPFSVMMPVIYSAGVTSKAGLNALEPGAQTKIS